MGKKVNKDLVKCIDTGEVFKSLDEAAEKCGISKDGIRNCCLDKCPTAGGKHWCYTPNIEWERKDKIRIAMELCYSSSVISQLQAATTVSEITAIMRDARRGGK